MSLKPTEEQIARAKELGIPFDSIFNRIGDCYVYLMISKNAFTVSYISGWASFRSNIKFGDLDNALSFIRDVTEENKKYRAAKKELDDTSSTFIKEAIMKSGGVGTR